MKIRREISSGKYNALLIQTESVVHPPSYPMGIRRSFPRGKAAGA
jgi:hypothetical protein